MGVQKKGKRKLIYAGNVFFWYVGFAEDYSPEFPSLQVLSSDKKIIISYMPNQPWDNPFLIITRAEYGALPNPKGIWTRIKTPDWNISQVTPAFVRLLLEWCFDEQKQIVEVDYLGNVL